LLLYGRSGYCSAGDINLRPLRPGRCTSSAARRVNDPERFGAADFAILHFLHDAIAQAVEEVSSTRLRDDVPTRSGVASLADSCRCAERTAAATVRACSKRPHPKIECCERFLHIEIRPPRWRSPVIGSYNRRFEITGHHCKKVTCAGGKPKSSGQWQARIHVTAAEGGKLAAHIG